MALPDPVTRKEMYLNKAATGSGRIPPEPVTREEMYLEAIAEGGGGGGGGGGMLKITGTVVDGLPVINKTWQEIHDAEGAYICSEEDGIQACWYLSECFVDNGDYRAGFFNPSNFNDGLMYFTASAANDIPVFTPNP